MAVLVEVKSKLLEEVENIDIDIDFIEASQLKTILNWKRLEKNWIDIDSSTNNLGYY